MHFFLFFFGLRKRLSPSFGPGGSGVWGTPGMSVDRDAKIHGAFGDSVVGSVHSPAKAAAQRDEDAAGENMSDVHKRKTDGRFNFKPNAIVYLKSIKEPERAEEIRRCGCSGWPCHDGYLCDFCMLRPEWVAESKVEPLQEEVSQLRQTVADLRKQQADVETLKKAERLVTGKHWSTESDSRITMLNSMIEDSRARLEAQEATAKRVAAETVRDSLLVQVTTLQQDMAKQERELTLSRQKVEALTESLADNQHQLRFANGELEEKRMTVSDAIKEKSRYRDVARNLQATLDVQNHEIMVRNEQTKALIEEVQRLQDVEKDRDKFRDLAQQRAEIGQSIMDAVADDIVMAERTRDEHWHQIRKLNKDLSTKGKTLANQNNQMSKLRSDLTEAKRVAENAEVTIQMLRSSSFTSSRASSKKR